MGYSRFVTLPKDWLRNTGLENGGDVELIMDDEGRLVCMPLTSTTIR